MNRKSENEFICTGIGLAALDRIMLVPHYPMKDEKTEAVDYRVCGGGPVANAVHLLAELGEKTAFIGVIGDDPSGNIVREEMNLAGVQFMGIVRNLNTPEAQIWVEMDTGKRTVVLNRKGNFSITPAEIPAGIIENSRFLLLDGRDAETCLSAAEMAHQAGRKVVYDLGSVRDRTEELIESADYLIVSENFAKGYFKDNYLENALKKLFRSSMTAFVITIGERGCLWRDKEGAGILPGFQMEVKDTTGAGDAFHGGFIYGLNKGWNHKKCIGFASACATMTCRLLGGRGAVKNEIEVWDFMKESHVGRLILEMNGMTNA